MALGNVTNLGLSSSKSMLNEDLVKKLKEADEAGQIRPLNKKLDKNKARSEDLGALKTLVSNVNVSAKKLNDENLYLKRSINTTGKSASMTVSSGVSLQNFTLDVTQLAQRDTYQSSKFASAGSIVGATSNGKFDITINGQTYSINVKQSSTYQDIVDQINEKTGGNLEARIINVGGSTNPYQIVLQSKETGAQNAISISNDTAGVLDKLGWDSANIASNKLLTAQDAVFTYNGVSATRTKNTFNDLRPGISITLNETGKTTATVTQDTAGIADALKEFVKDYNLMTTNLSKATDYDEKTGESGSFQSYSEIISMRSTLARMLTAQDEKGRDITQFGIKIDEKGQLSFDEKGLNKALAADAENVKDFFMGSTVQKPIRYLGASATAGALNIGTGDLTINGTSVKFNTAAGSTAAQNATALMSAINSAEISGVKASLNSDGTGVVLTRSDGGDINVGGNASALSQLGLTKSVVKANPTTTQGVFSKLHTKLVSYVGDGRNIEGLMNTMAKSLKTEGENLNKEKTATQTLIDDKYTQMKERFIQYDTIIAKLNSQFSTLKSMIDAEMNSKK